MRLPKLGVLSFSDPREEVYTRLRPRFSQMLDDSLKALRSTPNLDIVSNDKLIRSMDDVRKQAMHLKENSIESLLVNLVGWTYPKLVVSAVSIVNQPCAVLARNASSDFFAVSGSLSQVGIRHIRIVGDTKKENVLQRVVAFARAGAALTRLRGQTYGVFGGRSLGMYTAVGDPSQYQRVFGVDVEHVDQLEIVREAEKIPREQVQKFMEWLEENCGAIEYDNQLVTKEKVERQIRCYLATKELAKQFGFDFIGIKCQPELSDKYVNQCLTAMLMPDPYDADGSKEPVMCACEVDYDGAMTMQIMKIISGGKPVLFMDLFLNLDDGIFNAVNCGGQPSWFAECSDDPAENLKKIRLRPHFQGKAGGAAITYVCKPGKYTLARLCRRRGKYWMAILLCNFIEPPPTYRREPNGAFMDWSRIDIESFIHEFDANHIHAVVGDYTRELMDVCKFLGIEARIYNRQEE